MKRYKDEIKREKNIENIQRVYDKNYFNIQLKKNSIIKYKGNYYKILDNYSESEGNYNPPK